MWIGKDRLCERRSAGAAGVGGDWAEHQRNLDGWIGCELPGCNFNEGERPRKNAATHIKFEFQLDWMCRPAEIATVLHSVVKGIVILDDSVSCWVAG